MWYVPRSNRIAVPGIEPWPLGLSGLGAGECIGVPASQRQACLDRAFAAEKAANHQKLVDDAQKATQTAADYTKAAADAKKAGKPQDEIDRAVEAARRAAIAADLARRAAGLPDDPNVKRAMNTHHDTFDLISSGGQSTPGVYGGSNVTSAGGNYVKKAASTNQVVYQVPPKSPIFSLDFDAIQRAQMQAQGNAAVAGKIIALQRAQADAAARQATKAGAPRPQVVITPEYTAAWRAAQAEAGKKWCWRAGKTVRC